MSLFNIRVVPIGRQIDSPTHHFNDTIYHSTLIIKQLFSIIILFFYYFKFFIKIANILIISIETE